MARVTAVLNQKGGVGKSTTVAMLWERLNARGRRTLAIDLDPQGNLSRSAGVPRKFNGRTSLDLLTGGAAAEAVVRTPRGDVIPSSRGLSNIDARPRGERWQFALREALRPIFGQYAHIVIDTPPTLGIAAINAITAADGCIIPCPADTYSYQGLFYMAQQLLANRRGPNPKLRLDGVLLTRYRPRQLVAADVARQAERIAAALGSKVFRARIRESAAVQRWQYSGAGLPALPAGGVMDDINAFIAEFIEMTEGDAQ